VPMALPLAVLLASIMTFELSTTKPR